MGQSTTLGVPAMSARRLDGIYRLPNELRSLDEAYRLRHWDVPNLGGLDLWREDAAVGLRLVYEPLGPSADWLRQRRKALRDEMARRRAVPAPIRPPAAAPAPVGFVPVRGSRGR